MNTGFISIKDLISVIGSKDVNVSLVETDNTIHITVRESIDNVEHDVEHN